MRCGDCPVPAGTPEGTGWKMPHNTVLQLHPLVVNGEASGMGTGCLWEHIPWPWTSIWVTHRSAAMFLK